jgi:hypothetical protein
VHHLTYERLGCERAADLEVLCETCHRREHLDDPGQTSLGVYLQIASDAVRVDPLATIAELAETTKRLCLARGLGGKVGLVREQVDRIHSALAVVCGRLSSAPVDAAWEAPVSEGGPLTHQESHEVLCRLDAVTHGDLFDRGLHAMPDAPSGLIPEYETPHEARVRQQAMTMRAPRPRSCVSDRLREIFNDADTDWRDELRRRRREQHEIEAYCARLDA